MKAERLSPTTRTKRHRQCWAAITHHSIEAIAIAIQVGVVQGFLFSVDMTLRTGTDPRRNSGEETAQRYTVRQSCTVLVGFCYENRTGPTDTVSVITILLLNSFGSVKSVECSFLRQEPRGGTGHPSQWSL